MLDFSKQQGERFKMSVQSSNLKLTVRSKISEAGIGSSVTLKWLPA